MSSGTHRYPLVVFDMDGTLTEELLDFDAIRQEIGVPREGGILEHMARMTQAERQRAEEILHRHEISAADHCKVHEGATDLLAELAGRGVHTALLTRNSTACASRILSRHGLRLDFVATRDHRPHKPHPEALLTIARRFGIPAGQTLMVGDYLYDLQTAAAAAVDSALLRTDGPWPSFAAMATYRIRRLAELLPIIETGAAA